MSGHIFDMVNRIAQNQNRKRKKFRGDNRKIVLSEKIDTATAYDFPTVSEAQLRDVKLLIQEKARRDRRKSYYVLAIAIILSSVAIWIFLRYFKLNFDGFY